MNNRRKVRAVVLAAGKGTRMKAGKPKLLIQIKGKPIIARVVEACYVSEIERIYVVVGQRAETIKKAIGSKFEFVVQRRQLGTGHALMQVRRPLRNYRGDLVVLVGDSPFLTRGLIRRLISVHRRSRAAATFLTTRYAHPPPYARVIRDGAGGIADIREENQCTPDQKRIKEVVTSHYCFRAELVLPLLSRIRDDNPKHEYYLTDILPILIQRGCRIEAVGVKNPRLVFGINNIRDLRRAMGKL